MPKLLALVCLLVAAAISPLFGQGRATQYYNLALEQVTDENYDSALHYLNRSIVARGTSDAYFLRGTLYEIAGEQMRALDDYTSCITLSEGFREAYFKRGELFYKNGVYESALKDFDHLLSIQDPENTQAIFFRVDPLGQEQVRVSSMVQMKGSIHGLRGLTYQAIGRYDQALEDLNRAISLDSSSQNVVNRALLYKEMGDTDKSLEQLKLAVRIDPRNEVAWFNLVILDSEVELPATLMESADFGPMVAYRAVEAFEEENYTEAEALFKQALRLNPKDPTLLLNAGRLDIKNGNLDQAKNKFQEALLLDETRLETYYLMGNAFFRGKAFEEAVAFYEQFLLRDRSNAQIWYNAAMAYFELQDLRSACNYLEEAKVRGMSQADHYLQNKCNQ